MIEIKCVEVCSYQLLCAIQIINKIIISSKIIKCDVKVTVTDRCHLLGEHICIFRITLLLLLIYCSVILLFYTLQNRHGNCTE